MIIGLIILVAILTGVIIVFSSHIAFLRRKEDTYISNEECLHDKLYRAFVSNSNLEAEIQELKSHIGQINQSDREATSYLIAKVNGVYYSPSRDEIVTIDDPELIRIGDLY